MAEKFHMQREALRKMGGKIGDCGTTCTNGAKDIGNYGIDGGAFTWAGQEMAEKYEEYRKKIYDLLKRSGTVLANAETSIKGIADNNKTIEDDISAALERGLSTD